jgi:hypothetical protein
LFIDIPIVAEVERFLPVRLGGFNRGFIVGFSSATNPYLLRDRFFFFSLNLIREI